MNPEEKNSKSMKMDESPDKIYSSGFNNLPKEIVEKILIGQDNKTQTCVAIASGFYIYEMITLEKRLCNQFTLRVNKNTLVYLEASSKMLRGDIPKFESVLVKDVLTTDCEWDQNSKISVFLDEVAKDVKHLRIERIKLKKSEMVDLCNKLENLESILIINCKIIKDLQLGKKYVPLPQFKNLRNLAVNDDSALYIFQNAKGLTDVTVVKELPNFICRQLSIKELSLSISSIKFGTFSENLSSKVKFRLDTLTLRETGSCCLWDESSSKGFLNFLKLHEDLKVFKCDGIRPTYIKEILSNIPKMKYLSLVLKNPSSEISFDDGVFNMIHLNVEYLSLTIVQNFAHQWTFERMSQFLETFPNVRFLYLTLVMAVPELSPLYIRHLSHLEYVEINEPYGYSERINVIKQVILKDLDHVVLQLNLLSTSHLDWKSFVDNNQHLTHLQLAQGRLCERGMNELIKLQDLKVLKVKNINKEIMTHPKKIEGIFDACPKLQELELRGVFIKNPKKEDHSAAFNSN